MRIQETSTKRRNALGRLFIGLAALCFVFTEPTASFGYDPASGDFSKENPFDVRIVSYNVQQNFISDPTRDAAFERILQALSPDIIVFEEIASSSAQNMIPSRLDSILPYGAGSWEIHSGIPTVIRTVIASRYPLSLKRVDTIPEAAMRGVTIALADLPDAISPVDVYLLGVHLKCCGGPGGSEDDDRQRSADAIASWLGDARQPGGNVTLLDNTPMIILGDFNLVGGPQPETTLLTGDIIDNGTFGPDVKGDWDVSDMTDLIPRDPYTLDADTWPSYVTNPSSRLDRFIYTDSVVPIAANFILNTRSMSGSQLATAGLLADDTTANSSADHLPIVMDLRLFPDCNANGIDDRIELLAGTAEDCNLNDIPDECDIASGVSLDTDGDGIPDECFSGNDCNGNGVDDATDLIAGTSQDCNTNAFPDECDIGFAISRDCNDNGIPDECNEGEDCNGNGYLDSCDLNAGTSLDCNLSGIPDDCELALGNFISESSQLSPIGINSSQSHVLDSPPPAFGDVTLSFESVADYGASNEYIDVDINGVFVGRIFDVDTPQCILASQDIIVPESVYNNAVEGDDATITMVPSDRVNPSLCNPPSYVQVRVQYHMPGNNDCNSNGVPDECDWTSGTFKDCNSNGVPDTCDTYQAGDFNDDDTVDLQDFAAFADCLNGPMVSPNPPFADCVQMCLGVFDVDMDGTVSLYDFTEFQRRFNAP